MSVLLDVLWHVSAMLFGVALLVLGCLPMALVEWVTDRRAAQRRL